MKEEQLFTSIAGYEDIKKELLTIRKWLLNKNNLSNENVKLPKGIIFYGKPGNGKTLFLKEYSNSFNVPVFEVVGTNDNISQEIHDVFNKSKEIEFSIILIDEIDLLISRKCEIERTLQSELDGINSNGNVLVLATTNSIRSLDAALLRSGRFDRIIEIENPNRKSRKELLDLYIKKIGLEGNIDTDYLSRIISGVCGADVSAILNDAYLRCGKKVTNEDIEVSYNYIVNRDYDNCDYDPSKANIEIAYHEVAHAFIAYKYKENFCFYKACFGKNYQGGYTRCFPSDEYQQSVDTNIQQIEISLAGYVMSKLKFKHLDSGCTVDLQKSRENAVQLVNKLGYSGPQYVLPWYCDYERMETDIRKRGNEKVIEKLIHQAEARVRKYLKHNMKKIDNLASIMMNKGFIDVHDLEAVAN